MRTFHPQFHGAFAFAHQNGTLDMRHLQGEGRVRRLGRATWCPSATDQTIASTTCVCGGQRSVFLDERDCGIGFDRGTFPRSMPRPWARRIRVFLAATPPSVPKTSSGRWRTARRRAFSIHKLLSGEDITELTAAPSGISSQKMGIHECATTTTLEATGGSRCASRQGRRVEDIRAEVELAYTSTSRRLGPALPERRHPDGIFRTAVHRCDACVDFCPMDFITFTENGRGIRFRQSA